MYNILIIEDDAEQARYLADLALATPVAEQLNLLDVPPGDITAAAAALPYADIVLADIRLEEEQTGIDIIANMVDRNSNKQIIYVTGYLEYAPDIYRTPHTWLLAKPVDFDLLAQALDLALQNLAAYSIRPLLVRSRGALVRVDPSRILYIESLRRKILIHEQSRVVETYAKISDIESRLGTRFMRCHNSFLVNMDHISRLSPRSVFLFNGEEIPISQRHAQAARNRFIDFIGRGL